MNDLRSRIWVQTDGQLKTGRDVVIAALLGADEMGFATAPLIATGCVMMRACHLNTCPVGVATQDPILRARFAGTPEHVVNFFFFVAEEARAIMAELGISRFEDLIGRVDLLEADDAIDHWKGRGIDLSNLLHLPDAPPGTPRRRTRAQDSPLESALDWELIGLAEAAIQDATPVSAELPVRNVNRAVGALLSHAITVARGAEGLPTGTIQFTMRGSAGQSFGAWLAPGVDLTLWGDANDYTGKGLSGGTVVVTPPSGVTFDARDNVIVGNTVLYGATSGKAFFRGLAGERFAVRNSGATAVVEGVGQHACEYMTSGTVVVLGSFGRNVGAGMSGGEIYVHDPEGLLPLRLNGDLVAAVPVTAGDELRRLLERHVRSTGSERAQALLDRFDQALREFRHVLPKADVAAVEDEHEGTLAGGKHAETESEVAATP
jgi:glutamate synthase (NADPH/NADH) large chain/glutamate synthase (ferredoxin)